MSVYDPRLAIYETMAGLLRAEIINRKCQIAKKEKPG
jgi:hypothetical protein